MTSQWAQWCLKSPASRLFTQPLFRRRSKKTSKLRVTGLCAGNSPVAGEFPAQMASNAENVSIWWRHHVHSCTSLLLAFINLGIHTHVLTSFTISPCSSSMSHNALFITELCTCVQISITKLCIVRYMPNAFRDLWDGFIPFRSSVFVNMLKTIHRSVFKTYMICWWLHYFFNSDSPYLFFRFFYPCCFLCPQLVW